MWREETGDKEKMSREELLLDSISCTEPIWLRISVEVTERDVKGVMLLVNTYKGWNYPEPKIKIGR